MSAVVPDTAPHPHVVPVVLAPLRPGDSDTVLQVFDELGPRSRALRFLTPKPRLTGTDLDALIDVDGYDRVALVARADGHPVGIARFVRDHEDPTAAEAAVTVVDSWQRRGVGTRLASALADRARELGITRILLAMSHDNEAAVRLMHRIADDPTRLGIGSGIVEFEIFLTAVRRRRGYPLAGVCA
jgi:GNAT superfamily N-acetyltransferase